MRDGRNKGQSPMTSSVSCRECGAPIDQALDRLAGARLPCECGATARADGAQTIEHAVANDYRKRQIKRRRDGKRRPYREEIDGDDLQRSTGRWMSLTQTVDRANNWYSKKVMDPRTGEVVHECEEPLSGHRGHGSAKRRAP